MLNKIFFIVFILLLGSCQNQTFKENKKVINEMAIDTFNYLPTSTTGQVVKHHYYTLSYNEKYENAEWVAYSLSPSQISKRQINRPYFIRDPKVKTRSAHYKNYYPNGYEKGHLLPAADRRFSEEAFDETFYTSNVSPMLHDFNGGIWNNLEKQVRQWSKKRGKLYIVTGGILKPGLKRIGREKVAVPNYFYKIVLDNQNPNKPQAIAFLIPHHQSDASLQNYVVSIDSIEKLTGIDFFPALPDNIEKPLEAGKHPEQWHFSHFRAWQGH
jgi:endonuclease G